MATPREVASSIAETVIPNRSAIKTAAEDFGCPPLSRVFSSAQAKENQLRADIVKIENNEQYRERRSRRRSNQERLEQLKSAHEAYKAQADEIPDRLHRAFSIDHLGRGAYWSPRNALHMPGDLLAIGKVLFLRPELDVGEIASRVRNAGTALPDLERWIAESQEELDKINQLETTLENRKKELEGLEEKYLSLARKDLVGHLLGISEGSEDALIQLIQANPKLKHLSVMAQRLANAIRLQTQTSSTAEHSTRTVELEALIWKRLRRMTVLMSISLVLACVATFLGGKSFFSRPGFPEVQLKHSPRTPRQDRSQNALPLESFAGLYVGKLDHISASLKISEVSSEGVFSYNLVLSKAGLFLSGKGTIQRNPNGITLIFDSRELHAREGTQILTGKEDTDELLKK